MSSTIAQLDESQYVGEIEQMVPSGTTDYCLPSIAVTQAQAETNSQAGTEIVISGNSKSVVSSRNVSAYLMQNENTSQPNSINTVPSEVLSINNSIGQNQSSMIHMPPPEGSNSLSQNQSVQPSSMHMPLDIAPAERSSLRNSLSENRSVQPSSIHMPSDIAPAEGSSLRNSLSENQSVQPSSMHIPLHIAPAEGSGQQQIGQNQDPTTHRQPGPGRAQIQTHQQPRDSKKEGLPFVNESYSQSGAALTIRTDEDYTSLQHSDNIPKKKVFILHSIPENSRHSSALLLFATVLRDMGINVSIDLFEQDKSLDNWSMWYEREILSSRVVLCIITPDFYKSITEQNRIKGYAIYNLMGDPTKDIAFRAVFLDSQKNMEDIPLSMRGATCYCISSNDLNVPDNDEFTNLYAFLTGQNRIEKPKLGKVIKLAPKKSRFGQARSQHVPINRDHMYQQRSPINAPQPSAPVSSHRNEQAKLMFDLLSKDTTQVKSLRYQKMFATLATNMTAKWEVLARMLEIRENNVFAIKSDHRDSVQEQAVQMFQKWLDTNGSTATLGVLSSAVYESGPSYYNLLDIVNKYAPK